MGRKRGPKPKFDTQRIVELKAFLADESRSYSQAAKHFKCSITTLIKAMKESAS